MLRHKIQTEKCFFRTTFKCDISQPLPHKRVFIKVSKLLQQIFCQGFCAFPLWFHIFNWFDQKEHDLYLVTVVIGRYPSFILAFLSLVAISCNTEY